MLRRGLLSLLVTGACDEASAPKADGKAPANAPAATDQAPAKSGEAPGAVEPTAPLAKATVAFEAPAEVDDPRLFVRIGPTGAEPTYEAGIEPNPDATVGRAFDLGGKSYMLTVDTKVSGDKTNWVMTWRRTAPKAARLAGLFAADKQESRGSCQNVDSADQTDGLWLELGVKGTEFSAADACAGLGSRRR